MGGFAAPSPDDNTNKAKVEGGETEEKTMENREVLADSLQDDTIVSRLQTQLQVPPIQAAPVQNPPFQEKKMENREGLADSLQSDTIVSRLQTQLQVPIIQAAPVQNPPFQEKKMENREGLADSLQADTIVSRLRTQLQVPPIQVVSHTTASSPVQNPPFQVSTVSLNSRRYTNRITLFIFLLHLFAAMAAISFFTFKAVQGVIDKKTAKSRRELRALKFWLPPIEGASLLGIILAFIWQKSFRAYPSFMVKFSLWACFLITMAAGILLLCFSMPATDGGGVILLLFSVGTGIYACWVPSRAAFSGRIFAASLKPIQKFPLVNGPAYLMMGLGFLWISLWCFAVIGALEFYYPPLTIFLLVVSLMWTAEVLRNVGNLTVSRVIALYYLRGMQCNVQFSFQRAASINLGSACLGSLFVPTIEALRIIARGLNLLEGEDEFLFSCAHCCLRVMESIFRYGNSWAFVHIAAYGKGFVAASQSTWELFNKGGIEELVDSDITSSICFLTGVSSGAICVIFSASWTFSMYQRYAMTVSLVAFFVGYLMTRIGMALPQACVACYYVCYAENPANPLFDSSLIAERNAKIVADRRESGIVYTPRFGTSVSRR